MNNATSKFVSVLIVVALFGGTWFFIRGSTGSIAQPQHATILPSAMALPDFTLLDQDGRTFTRESLNGNWSLLFFGFTNCPDICPTTMQALSIAREKMAAGGLAASSLPGILFLSVDPGRDSPEILKSYVSYFGEGISGLTGDMSELRKLTKVLGIYFEKTSAEGGTYNVDHTAAVIVVNPNTEFHALFSAPISVDELVHDLPLILASQ
jgi:protein SCO1/2